MVARVRNRPYVWRIYGSHKLVKKNPDCDHVQMIKLLLFLVVAYWLIKTRLRTRCLEEAHEKVTPFVQTECEEDMTPLYDRDEVFNRDKFIYIMPSQKVPDLLIGRQGIKCSIFKQ